MNSKRTFMALVSEIVASFSFAFVSAMFSLRTMGGPQNWEDDYGRFFQGLSFLFSIATLITAVYGLFSLYKYQDKRDLYWYLLVVLMAMMFLGLLCAITMVTL